MKAHYVTDLPLGYDDQTIITLTPSNEVVIAHPVMPPMIYDQTVMRWVEINQPTTEPA